MISYYSGQYREIAELFDRSVHEVAVAAYTPDQVEAWAGRPINYEHWRYRCELKRPFVYLLEERVAGFLEFDPDGHIDCHYTHPEFVRRGVATALLRHATEIARRMKLERLYVEASHLIRPLYEKHGFVLLSDNLVVRNGVEIPNWLMERRLVTRSG